MSDLFTWHNGTLSINAWLFAGLALLVAVLIGLVLHDTYEK